jgi:hypothetical protein
MSIVPRNRLPSEWYRGALKVELARKYDPRLNVDLFAVRELDA